MAEEQQEPQLLVIDFILEIHQDLPWWGPEEGYLSPLLAYLTWQRGYAHFRSQNTPYIASALRGDLSDTPEHTIASHLLSISRNLHPNILLPDISLEPPPTLDPDTECVSDEIRCWGLLLSLFVRDNPVNSLKIYADALLGPGRSGRPSNGLFGEVCGVLFNWYRPPLVPPVSHYRTIATYHRPTDCTQEFTDCVESSIRDLVALLVYDNRTGRYGGATGLRQAMCTQRGVGVPLTKVQEATIDFFSDPCLHHTHHTHASHLRWASIVEHVPHCGDPRVYVRPYSLLPDEDRADRFYDKTDAVRRLNPDEVLQRCTPLLPAEDDPGGDEEDVHKIFERLKFYELDCYPDISHFDRTVKLLFGFPTVRGLVDAVNEYLDPSQRVVYVSDEKGMAEQQLIIWLHKGQLEGDEAPDSSRVLEFKATRWHAWTTPGDMGESATSLPTITEALMDETQRPLEVALLAAAAPSKLFKEWLSEAQSNTSVSPEVCLGSIALRCQQDPLRDNERCNILLGPFRDTYVDLVPFILGHLHGAGCRYVSCSYGYFYEALAGALAAHHRHGCLSPGTVDRELRALRKRADIMSFLSYLVGDSAEAFCAALAEGAPWRLHFAAKLAKKANTCGLYFLNTQHVDREALQGVILALKESVPVDVPDTAGLHKILTLLH